MVPDTVTGTELPLGGQSVFGAAVQLTVGGVGGAMMTCPILLEELSVNQTLPSGPAVIAQGELSVGIEYSVIIPAVVIRPILAT
jgi:hypothetical protein